MMSFSITVTFCQQFEFDEKKMRQQSTAVLAKWRTWYLAGSIVNVLQTSSKSVFNFFSSQMLKVNLFYLVKGQKTHLL